MEFEPFFDRLYDNFNRMLAIPVVLLLLASGFLGYSYLAQGEVVDKGTDFTGGTEVVYSTTGEFSTAQVKQAFAASGRPGVQAFRQSTGNETLLVVQMPPPSINDSEAVSILENAGYSVSIESFRSISASVSEQFFQQAQLAFVMAFTIMSVVIFVAFKDVTPSLAVIFAAAGDIIVAFAAMSVLGVPLTLGSLAALLMLIGYSVDTDIVLSTRVLKRTRGSLKSRIWSSVKTGVTMSSGGIAGFTILYLVSYSIAGPSELANIAAVMVVGLLADIPFTWLGNAVILKMYTEGEVSMPWS